jgi:hypothetical protein
VRAPIVALAMILTFFTIACLLILDTSAPVSATPPAADEHVPSDVAEAERTPAEQAPRGPVAPQPTEPTPRAPPVPQQAELTPREPAAPQQVELHQTPDDPTADRISASEQIVFKSRGALETVDPRELLRQGAFPPK